MRTYAVTNARSKTPKVHAMTSDDRQPENFCIIPWIHLNVNPSGEVFQCCIAHADGVVGDLRQSSLSDIWNGEPMRGLRRELLANGQPESCSKCYSQERNGITSFRQSINKRFGRYADEAIKGTSEDGSAGDMRLRYWDFRFSNLCNMKCRICGHHASSAWHADHMAIYGPDSVPDTVVVRTVDNSIDDLYGVLDEQMGNVEEIYFAGGEPLVMDEHYYILEKLIQNGRGDVMLRYNTNLLKIRYKNWDNIDLWSNFNRVHVIASLDAMGPRAEYIRNGTVWETIDENIRRLMAAPNVVFYVQPTIQVMTILHLPDFVDYLLGLGLDYRLLLLNNVLVHPPHYHINTLGDAMRGRVRDTLGSHVARLRGVAPDEVVDKLETDYAAIVAYLDSDAPADPDGHATFIRHTDILDGLRGESFRDVFPELADHYDDCKRAAAAAKHAAD